jgi:hypothetical protein
MNRRRCAARHPETKARCELKAPHGGEHRAWRRVAEVKWSHQPPDILGVVLTHDGPVVVRRTDPNPLGRMRRAMAGVFSLSMMPVPPAKKEG